MGGGWVTAGPLGAYGLAAGGGAAGARPCICGPGFWAAGFGAYRLVGGGTLGGALYGDGPRLIDAGGGMVDVGGDWGREA